MISRLKGWSAKSSSPVGLVHLLPDEGLGLADDLPHAGVDPLQVGLGEVGGPVRAARSRSRSRRRWAGRWRSGRRGTGRGRPGPARGPWSGAGRRGPSAESPVTMATSASAAIGRSRSTVAPSTEAATAASARRRPMEAATSAGVTPAGYSRVEPSGSLTVTWSAHGGSPSAPRGCQPRSEDLFLVVVAANVVETVDSTASSRLDGDVVASAAASAAAAGASVALLAGPAGPARAHRARPGRHPGRHGRRAVRPRCAWRRAGGPAPGRS